MKRCLTAVVCAALLVLASGCCGVPCQPVCQPGPAPSAPVVVAPAAAPIQVTR